MNILRMIEPTVYRAVAMGNSTLARYQLGQIHRGLDAYLLANYAEYWFRRPNVAWYMNTSTENTIQVILETPEDMTSFQGCLQPQLSFVKEATLTGYGYVYARDEMSGIPTAGVYETNALLVGSGEDMLNNLSRMFPAGNDGNCLWQSPLGQLFEDNVRICYPSCNVIDAQLAVVKITLSMEDQRFILSLGPEFGQVNEEPPQSEPILSPA